MIIRSILSVSCPISSNCARRLLTWSYGSKRFMAALLAAGSFPVYDWGELLDTPPGQYAHFPWGHGYGEVMTATTATPLAVLMGFFTRSGRKALRSSSGTSASTSELGGTLSGPYLEQSCILRRWRESRSVTSPALMASMMHLATSSPIQLFSALSLASCWKRSTVFL